MDTRELICMRGSPDCASRCSAALGGASSRAARSSQKVASSRSSGNVCGPLSLASAAASACAPDQDVVLLSLAAQDGHARGLS